MFEDGPIAAAGRCRLRSAKPTSPAMINATRESVNEQLHTWRRAGVVDVERGAITVRRIDELERLAGALSI